MLKIHKNEKIVMSNFLTKRITGSNMSKFQNTCISITLENKKPLLLISSLDIS